MFFFLDFSFNFELKKLKKIVKKNYMQNDVILVGLTVAVMKSWIDKNWILENWINKTES